MADKIESALTAEEWAEGEFSSHYGNATTSFQVDAKGRVFTHSEAPGDDAIVIVNEHADAPVVLPKIIALANAGLDDADPRKITRAWIDALDFALRHAGGTGDYVHSVEEKLRPIRDALANYLPPV